jgi:aryl-alcohol dehydrogenase-like predicted oxidoreductase
VGCVGLGAMPLSLARRPDEASAIRVIHAALDAGITLIDTADVYCLDDADIGHNEQLIARALREWGGRREEIVVATKGGCERPGGGWTVNGRPEHLRAACEHSLAALGVDTIDLCQLHAPDPAVPFEESVAALDALKREGKIRHIGLSNVGVAEIEAARHLVEVVTVQNRCNPFERNSYREGVVDYCERNGIAFLPHSPVGGHLGHPRTSKDPTLVRIAQRRGATPYQVALAWLLSTSPVVIPIPGATRVESVRSSAAAADLTLDDHDLAQLGAAFPVHAR